MGPRIAPVDPALAEGLARELLDGVKKQFGVVPNGLKTMAQSPAVLAGYLGLSAALTRGALSPAIRERVALTVSQINGCDYCLAAHSFTARRAGLNPEQILAARRGDADDSKAQGAVGLAKRLVVNRGRISDAELADARQAGLSDAEIGEVVGNVALLTLTNYFFEVSEPEIDFPRAPVDL